MSDNDRSIVWAELMETISQEREPVNLLKADLRNVINAVDAWVSDNAISFNSSLPLPARSVLTSAQKARILSMVLKRRFLTGVGN